MYMQAAAKLRFSHTIVTSNGPENATRRASSQAVGIQHVNRSIAIQEVREEGTHMLVESTRHSNRISGNTMEEVDLLES